MVSHCCVGTPNIVPSTVTTLRFVNLYFIPAGLQCSNGMSWPLVSWTLVYLGTIRARRCDTHLVLPTSRKHHGVCMNFLWNNGIHVWYINIWGILMVNVTIYSIHGSYGSWNHGIHVMRVLLRDDSNDLAARWPKVLWCSFGLWGDHCHDWNILKSHAHSNDRCGCG